MRIAAGELGLLKSGEPPVAILQVIYAALHG